MRAVVYNGPKDVSVDEVADATIEAPTDAIVKITATNICGSDLHMYEGRTSLEPGKVIGHENLGEVVEVGPGVVSVKVGDRVCLPFNIGCGFCKNCERGLTGFCLTVQRAERGRRLRVRRDGTVQRRAGRVSARAVRRLQRVAAPRGQRGEGERLRHAGRHLPDRVARDASWPRFSQATASPSTVRAPSG